MQNITFKMYYLVLLALLVSIHQIHCQSKQSNESELINSDDYADDDETGDTVSNTDTQKRQPFIQRSPQQQFQPMYNPMYTPNANVQPNPLRLPNMLNLPAPAPSPRWVQHMANGLPANPNLPAGNQPYLLMQPYAPGDTKNAPSYQNSKTPAPAHSQSARSSGSNSAEPQQPSQAAQPAQAQGSQLSGKPWEQWSGAATFGGLPQTPFTNSAGQRVIVLPNKTPIHAVSTVDNSKLPRQQQLYAQPSAVLPQPAYPQILMPSTGQVEKTTIPTLLSSKIVPGQSQNQQVQIIRIQAPAQSEQQKQQVQTTFPLVQPSMVQNETVQPSGIETNIGKAFVYTKTSGRIGVHTTHGRLLLEPNVENFCDIRQYSDEQLLAKNLQRVEYFVANLTCSRYFFECAIGQTFLLNCTSKDQVFDINTINCNFKYNVKSCNEYDHILHCSIKDECQKDEFACCAEPQQCISYTKRCDGFADCTDGEDENNCPSCAVDEFPCVKSGKCISWDKRCNGIPDECFDQTNLDEQNCGGCPPEKFACLRSLESTSQTPVCIDVNLRCNGMRDCPRGEDELNCKSRGQKYLLCESQKQSVSKDQWCDGYEDCLDGSDEKYCTY